MRKRLLAALLLLALMVPFAGAVPVPADLQMRGVWVSSIYNLDYPSAGTVSASTLRAEADTLDSIRCFYRCARPRTRSIRPKFIRGAAI